MQAAVLRARVIRPVIVRAPRGRDRYAREVVASHGSDEASGVSAGTGARLDLVARAFVRSPQVAGGRRMLDQCMSVALDVHASAVAAAPSADV
jgi:hypothetical protein